MGLTLYIGLAIVLCSSLVSVLFYIVRGVFGSGVRGEPLQPSAVVRTVRTCSDAVRCSVRREHVRVVLEFI